MPRLLTDEELEDFTWEFPTDWPEYKQLEDAHEAFFPKNLETYIPKVTP